MFPGVVIVPGELGQRYQSKFALRQSRMGYLQNLILDYLIVKKQDVNIYFPVGILPGSFSGPDPPEALLDLEHLSQKLMRITGSTDFPHLIKEFRSAGLHPPGRGTVEGGAAYDL